MKPVLPRRKSLYGKYFVSYCCIALIPVIVVIVALMVLLRHNYTNSAKEQYRRAVIQTAAHFDTLLADMQQTAQGLSALELPEGDAQACAERIQGGCI